MHCGTRTQKGNSVSCNLFIYIHCGKAFIHSHSFTFVHSFILSFGSVTHSFVLLSIFSLFYVRRVAVLSTYFILFATLDITWNLADGGCKIIYKKNLTNDHVCRVFGKMQHPKLHKTIHTNYINDYNNINDKQQQRYKKYIAINNTSFPRLEKINIILSHNLN